MALTPSEVASLTKELSHWEDAEYVFSTLVTVGCLGEFVAEFTDWFTMGVTERKDRFAKYSTLLLIGSLAFELLCLVQTNRISGQVIGSLDENAKEASKKSQQAISDADSAIEKSKTAMESAEKASDKANSALNSSVQANNEAGSAKRRADELKEYLAQLATPREIILGERDGDHVERAARFSEVKKYPDTIAVVQWIPEYEPQMYALHLAEALQDSGWKIVLTNPQQSLIPYEFISEGVRVITPEPYPFEPGDPASAKLIIPAPPKSKVFSPAMALLNC